MSDRCESVVIIHDDRWGGVRESCALEAGHPGPHVNWRDACEPKAWLSWVDPPKPVHLAGGDDDVPAWRDA